MQPVLFTVPGLDWEVQSYGFFIGVALLLGWFISLQLARERGLDAQRLGPIYVAAAAAALVGARSAWVLQHPESYDGLASLVTLRAGTLAPFAGAVAGLLVAGGLGARARTPVWAWYDALAPALAVGVVLERVGALLAGVGFGRLAVDLPFSIRFAEGSPAFEHHRRTLDNLMSPGATESLPVHPSQLYAVVLGLGGVALCRWLWKRRRFDGEVFIGFALYALGVRSFVEEWFRADASAPVFAMFNGGQMFAVAMLGALWLVRIALARRGKVRAERKAAAVSKTSKKSGRRRKGKGGR